MHKLRFNQTYFRPEDDKILDQKEGVEKADFHSLRQKLYGLNISPYLYQLLQML